MDMASLPVPLTEKTISEVEKRQRREAMAIANALANGWTPETMAAKLAGRDPSLRMKLKHYYRKKIYHDHVTQAAIAEVSHGIAWLWLIPAMQGLGRRAARGRTDSIKLLAEITGFYNPKQIHEHTGEVKITIAGIERPPAPEAQVVDAEVVDE
jgi:hypothetical protein